MIVGRGKKEKENRKFNETINLMIYHYYCSIIVMIQTIHTSPGYPKSSTQQVVRWRVSNSGSKNGAASANKYYKEFENVYTFFQSSSLTGW